MSDNFEFTDKKAKQTGSAFSLVLNDNGADILHNASRVYQKLICNDLYHIKFLAVAFHDKDTNEFGDLKTKHYHIVVEFVDRMRLLTCANWVKDTFDCINCNQIQIEKCSDVGAQARYLCHLDDCDKVDYPVSIVETNNPKQFEFYCSRYYIKDEQQLVALIDKYQDKRKLLLVLGLKQYKAYRIIINDLLKKEVYL